MESKHTHTQKSFGEDIVIIKGRGRDVHVTEGPAGDRGRIGEDTENEAEDRPVNSVSADVAIKHVAVVSGGGQSGLSEK